MALPDLNHPPSIDPGWLEERYRFDAQARSRQTEARVLKYFAGKTPLHIVDVGSGLAANTRYYAELLSAPQQWTLVEKDGVLAQQGLSRLSEWAVSHQWPCLSIPSGLKMELPNKPVEICLQEGSLINLDDFVDLAKVELVTANAVFDLFSQEQFQIFAQCLATRRLALLTTLNYRKMVFEPEDPQDLHYTQLYEKHMIRPQSFGSAMGADCSRQMVRILERLGFLVDQGESVWNLSSSDEKMLDFMLEFMEGALVETEKIVPLQCWIEEKRRRMAKGELKLRVIHTDIFARFRSANRQTSSQETDVQFSPDGIGNG